MAPSSAIAWGEFNAALACARRCRHNSAPPPRRASSSNADTAPGELMTAAQIAATPPTAASVRRVLFASLIGTTIEFFDFYIYATAAVLVFPRLFFPASDPGAATLASLATFGIAFFA